MGPGPMGMPPGGGGGRPPFGGRPARRGQGSSGGGPRPDGPAAESFAEKDFDLKQMEKESEQMIQMTALTSRNASFQKNSGGGLTLAFDGTVYEQVELVETFPFTAPYLLLSVRNPQNRNKEIGMIEDLERDFEPAAAAMIKEHLQLRYHMPVIEKILQTKEADGYTHFTVMTNSGEAQFSLRSNGTYVTALTDTRLIIQDLENNRFEIPDKRKLSAKELKKLDIFM